MIQCKDCEYFQMDEAGKKVFKCDPFSNIKEPECITKWQLIRLDMLLSSYQAMVKFQQKIAPLQDKLFKYMKREIDDIEETEFWKLQDEDQNDDKDDENKQ